jgi:hypothetical protein
MSYINEDGNKHLMKWILYISNERSVFKVDASNGVYEVNVGMHNF